jgi:hypothetical protein
MGVSLKRKDEPKKKSLLKRIFTARPQVTGTQLGTDAEGNVVPVTASARGAPFALSALADFATSFGAGPQAAAQQQQARAQALQRRVAEALEPARMSLAARMTQAQLERQAAQIETDKIKAAASRYQSYYDQGSNSGIVIDLTKVSEPGYKPVVFKMTGDIGGDAAGMMDVARQVIGEDNLRLPGIQAQLAAAIGKFRDSGDPKDFWNGLSGTANQITSDSLISRRLQETRDFQVGLAQQSEQNMRERQQIGFKHQEKMLAEKLALDEADISVAADAVEAGQAKLANFKQRDRTRILKVIQDRGGVIMTPALEKARSAALNTRAVVQEIKKLSAAVNRAGPVIAPIIGMARGGAAALGFDDAVVGLDASKITLGALAKSVSKETGRLTDQDIARVQFSVPVKTDSEANAKRKLKVLETFAEISIKLVMLTAGRKLSETPQIDAELKAWRKQADTALGEGSGKPKRGRLRSVEEQADAFLNQR